jgi:hypothetical protein
MGSRFAPAVGHRWPPGAPCASDPRGGRADLADRDQQTPETGSPTRRSKAPSARHAALLEDRERGAASDPGQLAAHPRLDGVCRARGTPAAITGHGRAQCRRRRRSPSPRALGGPRQGPWAAALDAAAWPARHAPPRTPPRPSVAGPPPLLQPPGRGAHVRAHRAGGQPTGRAPNRRRGDPGARHGGDASSCTAGRARRRRRRIDRPSRSGPAGRSTLTTVHRVRVWPRISGTRRRDSAPGLLCAPEFGLPPTDPRKGGHASCCAAMRHPPSSTPT